MNHATRLRKGAHLLGNLWQQEWNNIYPIIAPANDKRSFSLTDNLKAREIDPVGMVRIGEQFCTSLGFDPLPKTFWERSLFVKPRDRDVICQASATNIDVVDDVRLKMCIDVTEEDFTIIHHERRPARSSVRRYQRSLCGLPAGRLATPPPRREIHVIVGNLPAHKTKRVQAVLTENHRVICISCRPTRRGSIKWSSGLAKSNATCSPGLFTSLPDLARKVRRYVTRYNDDPKPIRWTYSNPAHRITIDSAVTVH